MEATAPTLSGSTAAARLAAEIHRRLLASGETVATAESLTGGLVGALLTQPPGASATYRGGLIVYATDLKATLADVPMELLQTRGAVDPDVAAALATGARDRLRSTWGLGLTGVAGPDPQDGRAVGTTYVAVAGPTGEPQVLALQLTGGRDEIRDGAATAVLRLLVERLDDGEYRR